jgi:DmsE family decaheme c-type cytochrome
MQVAKAGLGTLLGILMLAALPLTTTGAPSTDLCVDCHDGIVEDFATTPHGVYMSAKEGVGCESCHGAATTHIEEGDSEAIINPARHDQFGGKALCLTCHTDHSFDDWAGSAHNSADVTCADCHTVHASADKPGHKRPTDACVTCHGEVKAEMMMPSHHPIGEGALDCVDCHNPHGGDLNFVQNSIATERCLNCHAEKEGPFVYEHAPVQEDCMICHTPHGSVADNLLKQSEPALCLNCHPMHFHATVEGWDGDFAVPLAPERAGTSTPEGWKYGMLTKCTQCHTAIHGTDMTSQTISTGGNALTR